MFPSEWTNTFRLFPNQLENGKYNLISVWLNKNSKRFHCVYSSWFLGLYFFSSFYFNPTLCRTQFLSTPSSIFSSYPLYTQKNGIAFGSKSKEIRSPQSYSIRFERKCMFPRILMVTWPPNSTAHKTVLHLFSFYLK